MGNKIGILDCTLRDGGYVNNFNFGKKGIKNIIKNLTNSGVDIIECGFLMNKPYDENKTIFNSVSLISKFIPEQKKRNNLYVGMIALGDIPIDMIEDRKENYIDGIRVTFHKPQIDEALKFIEKIKNKGYKVFIQPVGTTSYSDKELIDLIHKSNEIKPYAFYLVDTLSILDKKSIIHMFEVANKTLDQSIKIGYHSHNNMQLAYSNAQLLVDINEGGDREIIIDSSVFGMGRGAGNLCTELIMDYLNKTEYNYYNLIPILDILDGEIAENYSKTPWGYNTSYYLASTHKCHPNYASFLLNKQMISARDINNILNSIPMEKRDLYNKDLIEEIYLQYQQNDIDDSNSINIITNLIGNKDVLLLGGGSTIISERQKIIQFIKDNNPFVVSINFVGCTEGYNSNISFFSNSKKFFSLDKDSIDNNPIIVTSNIIKESIDIPVIPVNLSSLLVANQYVYDNAGLMFIKLLLKIGSSNIYLAGFDGFKNDTDEYARQQMLYNPERELLIKLKNSNMKNELNSFQKKTNIIFITRSLYE